MDYEKQLRRFMKRKAVNKILGDDYVLSSHQKHRLCKLLDVYKTPKNMENMLSTVANFIYYDVSNYVGRYRRLMGTNGTSSYTQMLRYGRHWQEVYESQSLSKVKHFQNRIDYWVNKGYSMIDARQKVSEIQTARGNEAARKLRGTSTYTVRSIEYWLNNGYSESDAREQVQRIQTTNGLDFYKRNYPDNYEEKFRERIEQWQQSYNKNNLNEINLKKSHTVEGALARGLTLQEALDVRKANLRHMQTIRRMPSKISQKFCDMLETKLYGTCYYADKNYEKLIAGYRVDFYHKETQTVVEFYGDFYHRNPTIFEASHLAFGIDARTRWEYDKQREESIQQDPAVKNLFVVWESKFRKNPTQEINNIIEGIL